LSLGDIVERLRAQRDVATTTVATMLRVMSDKGLVARHGAGRAAVWQAQVTQESTAKRMVRQLVARVFDGSAERLAAHLVEGGQLTAAQLADLRKLIDQHADDAPSPAPSSPSAAPSTRARGKRS
jgi:predicted transcriptional regulator